MVKRWLIDAGNTNIKLAWVEDDRWLPVTVLPCRQMDDLASILVSQGAVDQVWVSNVAGREVAQRIVEVCTTHNVSPRFITAQTEQCGVRSAYQQPEKLGSDRWAALIAAWHRVEGACLVVNCGTATTIDALSDEGVFMGGLILPGVELMQRSLAGATADLPSGAGSYALFPCNTESAIYSGAIQATIGAIRLQQALQDVEAPVLLGGGAAPLLIPHLSVRMVDNMVLQGLLLIAQDDGKA